MDLAYFKPKSDRVTVELVNPLDRKPLMNPDGSPMTITAYGSHSVEHRKARDEITDAEMAERFEDKEERRFPSISEVRKKSIEVLAKTTIEWNLTENKEPVEFSYEKAIELYNSLEFVFDQVQTKVNDYGSFLGNS